MIRVYFPATLFFFFFFGIKPNQPTNKKLAENTSLENPIQMGLSKIVQPRSKSIRELAKASATIVISL